MTKCRCCNLGKMEKLKCDIQHHDELLYCYIDALSLQMLLSASRSTFVWYRPPKNPLINNIATCSPGCDTSVACLFPLSKGSFFGAHIELSSSLSLHCLTWKLKIRLHITFLLKINLSVWKCSFFDLPSRSLMSSVPGRITGRAHGRNAPAGQIVSITLP